METAMSIQQILREEMRESTVITIAHRLEAVKGADYFVRLDKGRVVQQGAAGAESIGDGDGDGDGRGDVNTDGDGDGDGN